MKTVLVTGSSRGIGFAIASKFLKEGWNVAINSGHNKEELEAAYNKLKKHNSLIMGEFADVSNYQQTEKLFKAVRQRFGPVDVLINNAGAAYVGLFNTMPPNAWDDIMCANLGPVFNCSHLALQDMVARKQGVIVNISSIWGVVGASCEVVYSAAKGGVNSFTKALAKELGPSNIRVNAIACGAIDTSMNKTFNTKELAEGIPMGRLGHPKEVAEAAFFLASEKASYITGQIIGVDGGGIA